MRRSPGELACKEIVIDDYVLRDGYLRFIYFPRGYDGSLARV